MPPWGWRHEEVVCPQPRVRLTVDWMMLLLKMPTTGQIGVRREAAWSLSSSCHYSLASSTSSRPCQVRPNIGVENQGQPCRQSRAQEDEHESEGKWNPGQHRPQPHVPGGHCPELSPCFHNYRCFVSVDKSWLTELVLNCWVRA